MFSMEKLLEEGKRGFKRRQSVALLAAALALSGLALAGPAKTSAKKSPGTPSAKENPISKLRMSLLDMPLPFEANRGQADASVKFLTRAQGFSVFLMPDQTLMYGRNAEVLRMRLQNANRSPKLTGEDRLARISNYFVGSDRSKWLRGVPNYGRVRYLDVYSGIDMVYHSDQRQLEYDFVVKPGVDPNQIRIAFEGADKIRITESGDLELTSAGGKSVNHKPVVYQMIGGQRKLVDGEFALANNVVGFKIGNYDRTQPLVIDPTLQVLSFFGGTLNDEASGIAVSAVQANLQTAGVVFVGRSQSATLPPGSIKTSASINWDAFATGLNAGTPGVPDSGGTTILWTTYFGGSGDDTARGVAMDNQGNVYVAGHTTSANFLGKIAQISDAFLVKIAAAGGSITGNTLYGGGSADQGTSVALDYSTFSNLGNALSIKNPATDPQVTPNVVIGGWTSGGIGQPGSPNDTTKTPDGSQSGFANCPTGTNGCIDGFVATFDSSLGLLHATYIGGGGNDAVNGVAADVWGNIYATGYATPGVASNFPVTRGIAQTNLRSNFDAAQNPGGTATAFVAKWACRTGSPATGVTSPPFGTSTAFPNFPGSPFPICGGGNNLGFLEHSALFGGSAVGNTFVNPQQVAAGLTPITEAGLAIAVDQNGWGSAAVSGTAAGTNHQFTNPLNGATTAAGFANLSGFPDIVPQSESPNNSCNFGANGNNGFGAQRCAVSASNSATTGGFEPGVAGPHVYVVGNTASRDFVNSLVLRASCTQPPFASSTPVPALCPVPNVFGAAMQNAGSVGQTEVPGRAWCDPLGGAGVCPTGNVITTDLRIKTVASGFNSGQTQGWLASFQFPAVTTAVTQQQPGNANPTATTTLNPPTIPNYVILQPATCPATGSGAAACIQGGGSDNTNVFAAATNPALNFGCTAAGCPDGAFLGSWNAVAVDSDQQVYVIGQIGMSPAQAAGAFGVGAPNRLALELQRISPYANTPAGNGLQPNFCPGPQDAPCAFPLEQFPSSNNFGTDLLVDTGQAPVNTPNGLLNLGSFGQLLPGAPPFPNPNQPGGLGNGIAVSVTREAFFVGTTTVQGGPTLNGGPAGSFVVNPVLTNFGAGPSQAAATAALNAGAVTITGITAGGSGYLPNQDGVTPGTGQGIPVTITGYSACTTTPGPFFAVTDALGNVTGILPSPSGAGCVGAALTVSIPAPPPGGGAAGFPPAFLSTLGGANSSNANNGSAGNGPEDVIYGALQFFDAIATVDGNQPLSVLNFTATVNNVNSIIGPNGPGATTGQNASAQIIYINWQGQQINIPPGCTVTPIQTALPLANYAVGADGTRNPFIITPVAGNPSVFQISVNASSTNLGVVGTPGVVTETVVFQKNGTCTGVGQPPLESWDPLTLTISVSAPLNLSPQNTFVVTSALASGIVDQYLAAGTQLVANQFVNTGVDVSTANSNGPINFTAQIIPGQNWAGQVANSVIIPTPADIIYTAGGSGVQGGPTRVNVGINTQVLAGLPAGQYTALLMFAATPETPALPTSGSTACGWTLGANGQLSQIANFPTVPPASGTTSPACIPISITITQTQVSNPATLVFRGSGTPQQTRVPISNPTAAAYNFTAAYDPTPVVGTALPAANVFFVGTASTLTPATFGNTIAGTIPAGGLFELPIQINPAGLPTGVYSGQFVITNAATGNPTPQTTVPIYVYVGPKAGEDTPSGNGLGLMLPVNLPPVGTGGSQGAAPGTPGSYPLTLSVPSGVGANGFNQIYNPRLIQVTGLNNTSTTSFGVSAPSTSGFPAGVVSFTNPGNGFGSNATACGTTYGTVASLPDSPLGPSCAWSLWVDATALNSSNTTAQAGCPSSGLGVSGTVRFTPTGFPGARLDVPLTICVTDFPQLVVGMPNTYPNPVYGPNATPGLNSTLAQPSNLVPGFQQSVVEMPLAVSGQTAAPINLFTAVGNSSQVCKILDIRTNGGTVNNVTIAPTGVQWLTVQSLASVQGGALFLGPNLTNGSGPNTLRWNSGGGAFAFNGGITGLGNATVIPATPPFAAGPVQISPDFQTFALCVNTDPVGNVSGTFSRNVVINGAGVGSITIPVNMVIGNGGVNPPPGTLKFSQIGTYRPTAPVGTMQGVFALDANGNNAFDTADKLEFFGLSGDIPVAGDWDGTGVIRVGVYRPSNATWYLDMNNNGLWDPGIDQAFVFGIPSSSCTPSSAAGLAACGDIPVVGDWGGTGTTKVGIYRSGVWFLDLNNNHAWDASDGVYVYGQAGDLPVVSNWSGAGTAGQIGVYRRGTWYVDSNGDGVYQASDASYNFGGPDDFPVTGYWSNANPRRIGVFSAAGQWFLDINGDHLFNATFDSVVTFGAPGDLPVVGGPWLQP